MRSDLITQANQSRSKEYMFKQIDYKLEVGRNNYTISLAWYWNPIGLYFIDKALIYSKVGFVNLKSINQCHYMYGGLRYCYLKLQTHKGFILKSFDGICMHDLNYINLSSHSHHHLSPLRFNNINKTNVGFDIIQ